MADDASFGQWLLNRRKDLRLQRTELAAQIGCAVVTLRKIEADERRPSAQLATLLAERLGLAPPDCATFVRVARGELPIDRLSLLSLHAAETPPASAMQREPSRPRVSTNLPAPLTSFVGRDQELAAITALLTTQRLVTLSGVGGVGKTRIAIEVGLHLVQSSQPEIARDGIWLVELAALAEPALVASAMVRDFRLPEQPGRNAPEQLQEHLVDKQLLLILDNCEHLVAVCAALAEQLLLHCWQLRILATSREPLRVPGEWVYPLLPLGLPGPGEQRPDQIHAAAAAQLFLARMHAGGAGIGHIRGADSVALAQICRQLDGIPLALELAAPLSQHLGLGEIAAQLQRQMAVLTNTYRTAIPRHQTMHSALIWSYRLLAPEEQRLLAYCAVFAGGCTLAAVQVIYAELPTVRLLATLQRLVATSLVVQEAQGEQARYRLLEPVRQFAQAQLAASGEEKAMRDRHAEYFLTMLAEREIELKGARQREILAEIERESENMRTAWWWASEQGAVDLLGQAVGCLNLAYEWLGRSADGLDAMRLAANAVASMTPSAPAELHAVLLAAQAHFTFLRGDMPGAAGLLQQAQTVLDASSAGAATDAARAWVLLQIGRCVADQDLVAAQDAFAQSHTLCCRQLCW